MTTAPFRPEWHGMTRRELADSLAAIPDVDYDDTPPTPRTPEQTSRERRRFWHLIDPWAPVPAWYVNGACVGCGGKNGHGGSCPHLAKERTHA